MKSIKGVEYKNRFFLKDFTSFKIGGEAEYFFFPNNYDDLHRIYDFASSLQKKIYVLGGGSNILVKDGLLEAVVLKLGDGFRYIRQEGVILEIGAAVSLSGLINYCIKQNLSGMENFAGIPATIGGMVAMNASSFGKDISSLLEEIEFFSLEGRIEVLNRRDLDFSYRWSNLSGGTITKIKLRLAESSRDDIIRKLKKFLSIRFKTQDYTYPNAGCVFKNPQGYSAGYLIEQSGLKGRRYGAAAVSDIHANFIVNRGNASAAEVGYLIEIVKRTVYNKFHIYLEEEIVKWT